MDADFLLIHKMKNGDEEAIEVFVKKYYSTIRNYCRLLCSKGDDYVSSTLFSCLIWIAVWTLVVLKDSIYEHISTSIWCGMMILSVLCLCYSIWRVWKCSERYYESNGASV